MFSLFFLEDRVNERCYCAALGEDNHTSEKNQHNDHRQQPELFSYPQEQPKFSNKRHITILKTVVAKKMGQGLADYV